MSSILRMAILAALAMLAMLAAWQRCQLLVVHMRARGRVVLWLMYWLKRQGCHLPTCTCAPARLREREMYTYKSRVF
jgi:hypothetical protein